MKKNNIRAAVIAAILLLVYHLVIFIMPFLHNGIFWLSYGFTLDAFVIAGAACVIAFRSGADLNSKFFGYPVARTGIVYLLIQLVISIVFMALAAYVPIWLGVLVYALALAVAVIGIIVKDTVRDFVLSQDMKLTKEVALMRAAQSKLNQMIALCNDVEAAAAIRKLAEDFRFSDPVSAPSLTEIEADLSANIDELQKAIVDEDYPSVLVLCKHTKLMLMERNRLCKLSKNQRHG